MTTWGRVAHRQEGGLAGDQPAGLMTFDQAQEYKPPPGTQPAQGAPLPAPPGLLTFDQAKDYKPQQSDDQQQAAPPQPDMGPPAHQAATGMVAGLHNVMSYPAELMASGVGAAAHAVGLAPNWHPGQATEAADQAVQQQYNQQYAGSRPAAIGNVAGQVLGTGAEIAAGGSLLGGAGEAASLAAPGRIGSAITDVGRILSGRAQGALPARVASQVASGALQGAAASSLAAGPGGPAPNQVGAGAIVGGALTPLAAGAGVLGGLGWRGVKAAFPSLSSNTALALSAGTNKVAEALTRDGIDPAAAVSDLRAMGPDATLADVGGENTRLLGQAVASQPGVGAQIAHTVLEGRHAEQPTRLEDAISTAVGGNMDFHGTLDDLMQKRSQDASPLYERAFSAANVTPKVADRVQSFVTDPIGQDALQRGLRTIQLEHLATGTPFDPADYGVQAGQDGKYIVAPTQVRGANGQMQAPQPTPGLRLLDAVKRGYDSIVEDNRDSITGKLNQYGRSVDQVRRAFVGQLRSNFPDYAQALDAWAGPSSAMNALRLGNDALKENAGLTARQVASLSASDKQFFRVGVGNALLDKVQGAPDGADATRRIFGNQGMRNRIAAAFDDPSSFQQFRNAMEQEGTFANTRNQILKGSQSSGRISAKSDLIGAALPYLPHVMTGNVMGVAKQAAASALHGAMTKPSDNVNAAVGQLLFTPGNADQIESALVGRQPGIMKRIGAAGAAGTKRSIVPLGASVLQQKQAQP